MKSNVDLTDNNIFTYEQFVNMQSDSYFKLVNEFNNCNNITNTILTGNKFERFYKKCELTFCISNNYCDRCGETIPWKFFNSSLCADCESEINSDNINLSNYNKQICLDKFVDSYTVNNINTFLSYKII